MSVCADVCVRFQQHAIDAFKLKYKHAVRIGYGSEFKGQPDKFEAMLRNFGPLIHSLDVDHSIFKTTDAADVLKMISKYTSALKELQLYNFEIAEHVNDVHPLFAKLETLSLSYCTFTNGAEKLLAPCAELKCLRIGRVAWDNCCIDQTFPKLEEVRLAECSTIDNDEFKKFITSNPTIKKLSIDDNSELKSGGIIHLIGQHLKNLVELEIDQESFERTGQFQKCTLSLSRLCSLKKLTLNYNGNAVAPLMKKLAEKAVPLEYLTLKKGSIDSSAIKSMSELIKLNEIEMENIKNLTDDHVVMLAKELPQLHALRLEGSTAEDITIIGLRNMLDHAKTLSHLVLECASNIQITMNDYQSMLKSVQIRPKKIKLEIEITGSGDKLNVSEKVLAANREWLWIDEEIEDDDDEDDDDMGDFAMITFHMIAGLHRFLHNHDSDESAEDETNNSNGFLNFDLD